MHFFSYFLAVGGNYLVVVLHVFSLILEGFHGSFTAFIHDDGSDFQDNLGVEVVLGVGYGNGGINGAIHHLKYLRGAFYRYVFGHLGHFFRGCAGCQDGCCSKKN